MSVIRIPELTRISVDRHEKMIAAGVLTQYDRVELIEGDMLNMPGIDPPHSFVTARLNELLVLSAGTLAAVFPGCTIRSGDFSMPEPDLMLLRRREAYYSGQWPLAPAVLLLVEVSDSSLGYDKSIKRSLSARYGVAEYWVIDVQGEEFSSIPSRRRRATGRWRNAPLTMWSRRRRCRPFKSGWDRSSGRAFRVSRSLRTQHILSRI